ncbi:UDP-N-acetylmuramoyl-L-alanine--D-glutamate ligase, partial [Candidatus Uhrbacteria bacterium]|nr:UDP-N-acetylmuramoyl-L-alanine--D-glutamate ligase [Candidatus Uhrbacteria bacterium]
TLKSFGGLPHRLKLIRTIKGMKFYNDSASTNPETAAAAIASFPNQPKILIMGGKDKNLDYEPVAEAAYAEDVPLVVLFGENKKKIALALDKVVKTEPARDLELAVKLAYIEAQKLLNLKTYKLINLIFSPGAASFDMFENYKARGEEFEKIVRSLK